MDPLTHTLAGAALVRAGLGRGAALATATAVVAANAPDVDVVAYFKDEYFALAFRRGITHGLPALLIWPFVITGAVLLFDRFFRRRHHPSAAPVQARVLLLVATVAVATHPVLDWLNNYGMRWLLPFSPRWSYGDAVFIIDPWIWLLLGAALWLSSEWSKRARIRWAALGIAATAAVAGTDAVPLPAKLIWLAGISTLAVVQRAGLRLDTKGARALGLAAAFYTVLHLLIDPVETRIVRLHAERAGVTGIIDVMVAPAPANPFSGMFVIATADHYRFGSFHWLPLPSLRLDTTRVRAGRSPVTDRAARAGPMHDYLVWSRYPFFTVESSARGHVVRAGDMRYARQRSAGSLAGVAVMVSGSD
jgi:inner membrane protein